MQEAEEVYVKVACMQNVPDVCNLITVICLLSWVVDCVSPDKSSFIFII